MRHRIKAHFDGLGSAWTRTHRPLEVVYLQPGTQIEETYITLQYMKQFGWQNVRGGNYCTVKMTHPPHELAEGKSCFRCNGDHYVKDCPVSNHAGSSGSAVAPSVTPTSFWTPFQNGYSLFAGVASSVLSWGKAPVQEVSPVPGDHTTCALSSEQIDDIILISSPKAVQRPPARRCTRCGRSNHWVEQCFAKSNINGHPLY